MNIEITYLGDHKFKIEVRIPEIDRNVMSKSGATESSIKELRAACTRALKQSAPSRNIVTL